MNISCGQLLFGFLSLFLLTNTSRAQDLHSNGQIGDQFIPSSGSFLDHLKEGYRVVQVVINPTGTSNGLTVYYLERGPEFAFCSDLNTYLNSRHLYACLDLINSDNLPDAPPLPQ